MVVLAYDCQELTEDENWQTAHECVETMRILSTTDRQVAGLFASVKTDDTFKKSLPLTRSWSPRISSTTALCCY